MAEIPAMIELSKTRKTKVFARAINQRGPTSHGGRSDGDASGGHSEGTSGRC